jgi:hypothetical protein
VRSPGMRSKVRTWLPKVREWLLGDVADVVQVLPRTRPRINEAARELDVRSGLERWAGQLTRRRAAVLTRRYLLIAIGIALVPAVVVLAAGASRPFWVLAVLILAPLAGAVALAEGTSDQRAARLLDRSLDLHEQLGTALELQAKPVRPGGLSAMVLSEARVTLAQSFGIAQVRARRARAEWGWMALALGALVALIAVPRHATATHEGNGHSALAVAPRGGASAQPRQTGSIHVPSSHTTPLSTGRTTSTPAVQQVPLTSGGAKAAYGVQASTTPGGRPPAYVNGSGTVEGEHTKPGLAVSGGTGAAGSQSASSRPSAAGAGRGTSGSTAKGGKSGAGSTAKASSGAQGGRSAANSTTPGKTAGAAAGSQKGVNSGGTPAGGGAGTGKAAAHAKLGLQPYGGAGNGKAALPLQANYTPTSASHASATEGVSTTSNGNGNGAGQSAHAGSGTAVGESGTNFSVLPPTSDGSPSSDQDLLDNYFGSTNQLTFKGW